MDIIIGPAWDLLSFHFFPMYVSPGPMSIDVTVTLTHSNLYYSDDYTLLHTGCTVALSNQGE